MDALGFGRRAQGGRAAHIAAGVLKRVMGEEAKGRTCAHAILGCVVRVIRWCCVCGGEATSTMIRKMTWGAQASASMCSNVLKRDQEKGSETSGAGQKPGGVLKQHWASQLALTQQACHATPSGRRVGTRLQGRARRARAGQQLRQLRFTLGRGHGNQTQQQALHAKVALRRGGTAGVVEVDHIS